MTTYKVLTTIKANALVDDAPQRRADAMRANGYSVAQLGPGSAQTPAEEELLETWLLLEVNPPSGFACITSERCTGSLDDSCAQW